MIRYTPTCTLTIDKKPLADENLMRLISWEYEDCEGLDKLTLTFDNYDLKMAKGVFQNGASVEFRHGYLDPPDMSDPFFGIIDVKNGFREFTVECMEITSIFNTEEKVRIFEKASLNDLVGKIARENNLAGFKTEERKDAAGILLRFDYFQPKLQDLSFLYFIGQKIGYKVWIENEPQGQILYFMPRKYWMTPYMEFTYYGEAGQVLDFVPESNTRGKRSSLSIGGIDLETKKAFSLKTNGVSTRRVTYLGERFVDYDAAVARYKSMSESALIHKPVSTRKEAEDVLAGKYEEELEDQIIAELHLIGEPKLKSKRVIVVNNVAEYSGKYYVMNVKHSSNGYTTIAKLTRNATFDKDDAFSRRNLDTVVNRNRPTVSEFLEMTKKSPKADYYRNLLR